MSNKIIKAFGKKVTREEAYQIILNDYICNIVYAQNTDTLEFILIENGWEPLTEWCDKELEKLIEGLCVENQPTKAKYK